MKKFIERTGVSAGTFGTPADGKSMDEAGNPGRRNARIILVVSAVAGASPNIVGQLKASVDGQTVDLGSPTTALTGVGAETQLVNGVPEVVWLEVTASGTITASSLSFAGYIEAV